MRFFLIIALLFTSLTAFSTEKETARFTLDHQMSEMCKKKITENLRYEKGVANISVDLKENIITITYNPEKTNPEKLIKAFKKIGFNAFEVIDVTNEGSAWIEIERMTMPKPIPVQQD